MIFWQIRLQQNLPYQGEMGPEGGHNLELSVKQYIVYSHVPNKCHYNIIK